MGTEQQQKEPALKTTLPDAARVVIIGGGIVGCSVAYHLTKLGIADVVLLERKQLTCGTTWHAAGLVAQLRPTENMTHLARYSQQLYAGLEAETGQATGFMHCGSLSIATTKDRLEEMDRAASMAKCFDVACEKLSPEDAGELWPLMDITDVVGAYFFPSDARTNPTDTTMALAKGARNGGARIFEDTVVLDIIREGGRACGVTTDHGEIKAEFIVNCTGMWAHEFGRKTGMKLPLQAAEHYYLVTETLKGMNKALPVLRDYDHHAYYREETGKLMLGLFEPIGVPWGMDGIPESFCFDDLPPDWDRMMPYLEAAMKRIPSLENTGIKMLFNGPESFTPDGRYMLGECPELKNMFVAAGFNSVGIQSAGGAGLMIADWIVKGHPPKDLWDVNIHRMLPFQNNKSYLKDRTAESLGLLYAMHWPFRQYDSARNIRKSPLHDRLAKAGASFGEAAGWERANWFAPKGVDTGYRYSYGRQNWFEHSAVEHRAVRERVGILDQSSFSKFLVQGRDAEGVLNNICANDVAVTPGKVVYTQWLNERGTIEADLTVTRLDEDRYFIVTGPTTHSHVLAWLERHIPEDAFVTVTDVTSAWSTLNIQGPNSRALIASLTNTDMSGAAFPFSTAQEIEMGYATVLALRISYVGELGWELYIPSEYVQSVYDLIIAAGTPYGLQSVGYHALNSLRMEKAYRDFGHDICSDDTPFEAGLGFAVALDKADGFIGRQALLAQKQGKRTRALVQFVLEDPEPLMYHNEPIYRDGDYVGYTLSAMYGHTLGASVALGYVCQEGGVDEDFINNGRYEIEIAGKCYSARASLRPFYDPQSARVKS